MAELSRPALVSGILAPTAGTPAWTENRGFSASITDNGTGDYSVTFTTAFTDVPTILVTVQDSAACYQVRIHTVSAAGFTIEVYEDDGTTASDACDALHLLVIGPGAGWGSKTFETTNIDTLVSHV